VATANAPAGPLRAGRVGRPHGLDGSFHVTGAVPALLPAGGDVMLGSGGESRRIDRRAGHDSGLILRLAGCSDRDSAQALRGIELFADRALAPPLGEDEWWAEELEGCRVHDRGKPVGVVTRLLALPSCEVLEVVLDGAEVERDPLLVPLVGDAVRFVDVEARQIDVDLRFLGEDQVDVAGA
jgi:16S rRNA processing protein RimM